MNFIKITNCLAWRIVQDNRQALSIIRRAQIQERNFHVTSTQLNSQAQKIQKTFNKTAYHRKSAKRSTNLHNDSISGDDGQQSIIAYNLSEELRIENAKKLLQIFSEYKMVDLHEDLRDEAVLLSASNPIMESSSNSSASNHQLNESTQKDFRVNEILLFREGSIVFWGVPYNLQKRIFFALSPLKMEPYENELIQDERENVNFELVPSDKSKLVRGVVHLGIEQDLASRRLDQFAFSHAISQSVKLAIWEALLDQYIESIRWITDHMKSGKDISLTKEQVFSKTGELFELKHNINLSSDLLDMPDVYWDRHDQEILFTAMISNLNIKKRTEVINDKLNNCCELMNLLANHMNDKHHIRLEWMIIILIMVEVLFEICHFFT